MLGELPVPSVKLNMTNKLRRQCALPIQNLIVNQDLGDRAISDAVVVLSEDFTFVTTSENDGVRVVSFPMFGSVNMTVLRTEIGKEIQVLYPKETGFELCNGYKTAIQNMSIAFEDTADAQTAENIILRAEHELKDMKGAKERGTTVAVSQSKRSIAYINLWSPEAQPQQDTCPKVAQSAQEFRQYGSPSPLQRRSQPVQQRRGTGSETMSETEFLEIDDQPSLVERLRASQEDVRDDQSHSDFNAKVDEALARQRPSRSNTVTALPEPVREEEGATNSPPHLPKPCVERKSASNSTVRPDRSLNTNPNVSGADVKRSSGIIGAIDISPEPPNKTTGASAKLKKASMAKLSALRPQARSSKTASATKPLAGPAARLAGAQPQSSPNKSLKRKSAGAGMTKSPETTEEHSQFDIPDPSSDEEPPQKRTRPNGKQPARKPNASSIKGREPGKGGFKDVTKPAGRPRKTQNVKAAEKPKQSVASTRDRRPAKPKKYVEDSDSDLEEIDNPAVSPQKLSKHDSSHVGQSSTALKTVDKPNHQRRHFSQNSGIPRPSNSKKHEGDTEIQSSPQKTKSRVDKAQSQVAHAQVVQLNEQITTDRSPRAPPPPKPKANEPTSRPDDSDQQGADDTEISEEQAQDSYPMNDPVIHEAMTDSFHTLLQTTMQAGTVADTDKENVPPPVPQTPFGNEKTFVADVNAARSTSPNKTSKSQVPQSPEPAAPLSRTRHAVKAKELTSLGKSTDSTTTHRTNVAKKSEPEPDQDVVGTDVGDIPAEEPIGASTFITDDEVPDEQVNADRRDGPIDGIAEHNGAPIVSEKSDKRLTIDQQGHVEAGISLDADPDTAEVPVTQAAGRYLEEKLTDRREKFERKSPMQNSVDISSTKKRTLNDSPRPIVMKKRQVEEWTAGTSGDIGTLQFNRHRSSMNTCNSAEAPPQGPNAATEPRRGARLSATVRTEELRTPQRKFRSSEEVLTSEKATKRASLVHFTDHGPQNQGVSKKRASESSTEMTAPPPQTHHHQQAKQHEGRDETAETPSRELEVGNERPVSSDFEEGTDPVPRLSADGIDPVPEAHDHGEYNSNQRDNNQHPESHPLIQPEIGILQNHLSYPAAENSGDALAGETYVTPPTQELSSDVKDEELAANDEDEEEESEYRDESESVDISQEKSLAPSGEDSASELEVTATSLDSHPDGAVQSEKVITEARVAPRESIGLSQVMNHVHPQAKEKINTRKLRAVRTEAEANLSFGTSAVVESRIQGSSIHAAKQHITDDKARMAPPEKKGRQSVAQARQPDTLGKEADVRGSSGSHTTTTRAANSISQIRQASVMDAATSVSEPRPRLEIYREPATSAPVRIKRPSIANVSPEPQPTLGTPVPFHARLAYTTAEVVEHDRRKTESFLSEHSGNTTLTNGHSMSTMVQHEPLRQPHFPRGMTETTDGSPSPSSADSASRWDDSNRAQAVIRSPYRSLLEDVKEIADVSLHILSS